MTKYRIKKIIYRNNNTLYYPQYKHWYNLFWHNFYEDCCYYSFVYSYKTLEEAQGHIQKEINKCSNEILKTEIIDYNGIE